MLVVLLRYFKAYSFGGGGGVGPFYPRLKSAHYTCFMVSLKLCIIHTQTHVVACLHQTGLSM